MILTMDNANIMWQRFFPAGSQGNWTESGIFFAVLTLPAAADFALGAVRDAGPILQSNLVRAEDRRFGTSRRRAEHWWQMELLRCRKHGYSSLSIAWP